MDNQLLYFIIIAVGFVAFILAPLFHKWVGKKTVVNLELTKLGIVFKANAFGLMVVFGVVCVAAPLIFLARGYAKLQSQEQFAEEFLEDFDERFKRFDMTFKLIFPTPAPPNPREDSTDIAVWIRRKNENEKHIYNKVFSDKDGHTVLLTVRDLCPDDWIYVSVSGLVPTPSESGGLNFINAKFASDDIRIPVVHLNMTKVE